MGDKPDAEIADVRTLRLGARNRLGGSGGPALPFAIASGAVFSDFPQMLLPAPGRFARWWILLNGVALPGVSFAADAPAAPVSIWPQSGTATASQTSLFSFLPPAASHTGAGILIVPSSSVSGNLSDAEIAPVAQWLNTHGIAAFVLRYSSAAGPGNNGPVADL